MAMETVPGGVVGMAATRGGNRRGDRAFSVLTSAAGVVVLVTLAAVVAFLVEHAIPALRTDTVDPLTTKVWSPDATPSAWGIAALAFGTALSSVIALVLAVPVALGVVLFVTEYAPRRLASLLAYAADLLAAVPSAVYGLWGWLWLVPRLTGLQHFLATRVGWFPLFSDPSGATATASKSLFAASVVLAVMILPIVSALSREVLLQVDPAQKEAALALGATRWEVIRTAVLPPSRGGIVGATMLGLGRALGETIAIALVLGVSFDIHWHVLVPGGNTIAANIAVKWGEAGSTGRSALIASGLVLFLITLVVNMTARAVVYRSTGVTRSKA